MASPIPAAIVGKHFMTHLRARVQIAFDDRHVNVFMGPSAQKHSIDNFNADNFDHGRLGFIRGAQISVSPVALEGGPIGEATMNPPPGVPRWGAAWRDFFAKYYTRHAAIAAQIEDLPYPHQTIDLDPNVRDHWGLPAPRVTYDSRRPNELARTEFLARKLEEIGHAAGANLVWRAPETGGAPGGHHMGGTRMGGNPRDSVGEPLFAELGCAQPVHHGQFDFSHHGQRVQSDTDDPGTRLS